MALKHAFTSAKSDGGDATLVQPSAWNDDHEIDTDGATMATRADAPSAPSAGNLVLFGKTIGGGALPACVGPSGLSYALQPFLGGNKIGAWLPLGNSTSVVGMPVGLPAPSSLGTITARNVATTNLFTSMRRIGCVTASSAGNRALLYDNVAKWWRGDAAGLGGFRLVARFGSSDAATVAGARSFAGFAASSTIGNGADPSAALNIIGVGSDAADTNLQIMHNDGSGTATKVDLGANFPDHTLSVDVYELALFAAPNASTVSYQVTRLNTGHTASGTISTDLPAATQLLLPIFMRGNNATALAVGVDVMSLYLETDY